MANVDVQLNKCFFQRLVNMRPLVAFLLTVF